MIFQKDLIKGNRTVLDSKMMYGHKSVSILMFLKFCTMKEAKRYMKITLVVFLKRNFWGKCTILGPKMAHG